MQRLPYHPNNNKPLRHSLLWVSPAPLNVNLSLPDIPGKLPFPILTAAQLRLESQGKKDRPSTHLCLQKPALRRSSNILLESFQTCLSAISYDSSPLIPLPTSSQFFVQCIYHNRHLSFSTSISRSRNTTLCYFGQTPHHQNTISPTCTCRKTRIVLRAPSVGSSHEATLLLSPQNRRKPTTSSKSHTAIGPRRLALLGNSFISPISKRCWRSNANLRVKPVLAKDGHSTRVT